MRGVRLKDIYLGIDSGKMATKVAVYIPETDDVRKFSFRTKVSEGYMEDDQPGESTYLSTVNGKTYKVGNSAKTAAELETNKMTDLHKICIQTAIAMCAGTKDTTKAHVALGMPVTDFTNVPKRNEYAAFMLPKETQEVDIKMTGTAPVEHKKFEVVKSLICPESGGLLYLDPAKYQGQTTAIIDIGNLNVNGTYWNSFSIDEDYKFTSEQGGNILMYALADELSSKFGRCDANRVARLLLKPLDERKLVPNNPNPLIEEESKAFITEFLLNHVREIKRQCDTKHWSIDYLDNPLIFIGGTSPLLANEIRQVFGNSVEIYSEPTFANAEGFLARLVANELDIFIGDRFSELKVAS